MGEDIGRSRGYNTAGGSSDTPSTPQPRRSTLILRTRGPASAAVGTQCVAQRSCPMSSLKVYARPVLVSSALIGGVAALAFGLTFLARTYFFGAL